jgi:hypothetical protein
MPEPEAGEQADNDTSEQIVYLLPAGRHQATTIAVDKAPG